VYNLSDFALLDLGLSSGGSGSWSFLAVAEDLGAGSAAGESGSRSRKDFTNFCFGGASLLATARS
jgi:hypothetical protein